MENLLKKQFLNVINRHRNGMSPEWNTEPVVRFEDIDDNQFDIVDSKSTTGSIKRPFRHGTASYINEKLINPFELRFISYEDYLNQFVFDDGFGNPNRSMLPKIKRADFLVYNTCEEHTYFFVHELCVGDVANKRATAIIQLSSTLNLLYQDSDIKSFIDSFSNKICFLSAKDGRKAELVTTPDNVADGFIQPYTINPEPAQILDKKFTKFGFEAYETSIVKLK